MRGLTIALAITITATGCSRSTTFWDPPAPKQTHSQQPVENEKSKSTQRTARDNYVELREANNFNKPYEKYVCFNDSDEQQWFAVIGTTADAHNALKNSGESKNVADIDKNEGIFVQTYYKGVPSNPEPDFYRQILGEQYSLILQAPFSRATYVINWSTGRFRSQLFRKDRSTSVVDVYGKCELISDSDKQPGEKKP